MFFPPLDAVAVATYVPCCHILSFGDILQGPIPPSGSSCLCNFSDLK